MVASASMSSETPVVAEFSPEDTVFQTQIRKWKIDQAIVASLVQVYSDPTTTTANTTANTTDNTTDNTTAQQQQQNQKQEGHDRNFSVAIVEDTQWCTILRPSYPDNGNGGDISSSNNKYENGNSHRLKQDESNRYYFGGVDVGFPNPPSNIDGTTEDPMAVAVYVIIDARTMQVVYRDHEWIPMSEIPPYISTFLSFREIDPLERLVNKQIAISRPELTPSAILVDGNGIFHPRHSGIACFLGVRTKIPTIGIGKTLLWIENSNSSNNDNNANETDTSNNIIDKGGKEYQWTRSKLDKRINGVLVDVHRRILCDSGSETTSEDHSRRLGLANRLKKHNGLILAKGPNNFEIDDEAMAIPSLNLQDRINVPSREQLLEDLTPFCNGIAIPLEAPKTQHNHNNDDRFRFLGAALVGHGGSGKRINSKPSSGSKRPIIVSVGHKISLAEAASITACLSIFRIPEPVRQADLYGRELLRERKMM